MLKSNRLWQDDLDDQICWRFSKYKFVVNDTNDKFDRDLKYLEGYEVKPTTGVTDDSWWLPLDETDVKEVEDRIKKIKEDFKSLKVSLDEVTAMVILSVESLIVRVTAICQSKKLKLHIKPITEWNILRCWQLYFFR